MRPPDYVRQAFNARGSCGGADRAVFRPHGPLREPEPARVRSAAIALLLKLDHDIVGIAEIELFYPIAVANLRLHIAFFEKRGCIGHGLFEPETDVMNRGRRGAHFVEPEKAHRAHRDVDPVRLFADDRRAEEALVKLTRL